MPGNPIDFGINIIKYEVRKCAVIFKSSHAYKFHQYNSVFFYSGITKSYVRIPNNKFVNNCTFLTKRLCVRYLTLKNALILVRVFHSVANLTDCFVKRWSLLIGIIIGQSCFSFAVDIRKRQKPHVTVDIRKRQKPQKERKDCLNFQFWKFHILLQEAI